MLNDTNPKANRRLDLSSIQKNLFKALVFLLPLTIFPFPWDWTERAMSLLILSISTIILGLEILKLLWDGKISIVKSSMDIGFFLLLLSMLLSTIFSVDINTSLWGIDGRFGNGLIVFVAILLVAIVSRTFIKDEEGVRSLILFFLMGFFVNNVLSLLSFFGVNVWGLIPVYRNLYQSGLPLLRSSRIHILVNFVSVILCVGFIGEYLINSKRQLEYILSFVFGFLSIINIWLFSMGQSLESTLLLLGIVAVLFFFVLRTLTLDKEKSKQIFLFSLICAFLIAIPVIFLQIPGVRDTLLSENIELMSELILGLDISWVITGSAIVGSFVWGLFGLGLGTYSVAYHMFKPQDFGLLALGDATFHTGVNEVLTRVASGGLLWLFIWLFLGYIIVKSFISDLQSINTSTDKGNSWRFLIVDVVILTIFFSSFLLSYSVLVIFLLLAFVSLRSIIREYLKKSMEDKFLLKFWALNMSSAPKGKTSLFSFNIFLSILVLSASLVLLVFWGSKTIASFHVLRAEAYTIALNKKYADDPTLELSQEEYESYIESMDSFYLQALNYDKNNPLYNRKRAIMVLEGVGVMAQKFGEIDEEDTETRDQYLSAIMSLKGQLIDIARKGTDLSSSIYANWATRSTVYANLVGIGFNEHIPDAISSSERAINLNPLNYQLYYSMAQIYLVKGEQDNAMQLLTNVLQINPRHLPSILLIANLNKEDGNIELYASYLQAAKFILEEEEATDLEIYGEILKALGELEQEGFDLEQVPNIEELEGEDLEQFEQEGLFETDLEDAILPD
jgi:tetratricopeptide (TPR) repeat protein